MSKTKLGSNTIFTGSSKGLTIVANHCYAYSGVLAFDDNEITLLEFNTGKRLLDLTLMPYRDDSDSLDSKHRLYINDIKVWATGMGSGGTTIGDYNKIIIPSLSHVKLTIQNVSNTSNGQGGIAIAGDLING
jgi:hypothetical protein